ncbi:MAG: response regulator [Anaerolineae bacterium]|nr:response regulator [Anaerolineae bacterium]
MNKSRANPLVLVADDEIPTTVMLARIFEREGYEVRSVHDGNAALNAAQELLPDLILLDVQMPLMNGFEVLRHLRENPLTANIPTIIVTAKARQPTDVAHGLNLGADDFIHKPFDPQELMARAQSKIRARKLEEALHRRSQELEILMRVGEKLNQYLEVKDVLELVPRLALDSLPGDGTLIYHVDDHQRLLGYHIHTKNTISDVSYQTGLAGNILQIGHSSIWSTFNEAVIEGFQNGMTVPIQHGDNLLGMLVHFSKDVVYDDRHLRLFEGISRQAALALRNAQLYEIQTNYAGHLQEMVEEKTNELRSAQQMLIRAEKLASIGHLAASIAHEINNPLQPIQINLDDMLEDIQNKVPIDIRAIQTTLESVERIRRIVNQLLDFAGKRSTSNVDIQTIDINRVIDGVVNLNRKFFEKESMKIVAELAPKLPIYGSKDQLEQVFMNLALNAKAAMEPGGVLKITSDAQDDEIILTFSDNGCGIPPEQLDKIFDPFFSTKANGTGLGLFVSYGIIQGHHGTIEVQSKINSGTTFIIHLPLFREKDKANR